MSNPVELEKSETYSAFEELEDLVRGFEETTLPHREWTHQAHLTVALWYLAGHQQPEAIHRIRFGIQRYNRAKGIPTTPSGGYHETITLFWIRIISGYLAETEPARPLVETANEMIDRYGDKRLPFEYDSRDHLMSWEARTRWVEPDLKPLD